MAEIKVKVGAKVTYIRVNDRYWTLVQIDDSAHLFEYSTSGFKLLEHSCDLLFRVKVYGLIIQAKSIMTLVPMQSYHNGPDLFDLLWLDPMQKSFIIMVQTCLIDLDGECIMMNKQRNRR